MRGRRGAHHEGGRAPIAADETEERCHPMQPQAAIAIAALGLQPIPGCTGEDNAGDDRQAGFGRQIESQRALPTSRDC